MTDLFLLAYGAVMAALVGYGASAIVYEEYRRGTPSLVVGLGMFAVLPWLLGLLV